MWNLIDEIIVECMNPIYIYRVAHGTCAFPITVRCTKKFCTQKLYGSKGYTVQCIYVFYKWWRFGDLKLNFVFLNGMLFFFISKYGRVSNSK